MKQSKGAAGCNTTRSSAEGRTLIEKPEYFVVWHFKSQQRNHKRDKALGIAFQGDPFVQQSWFIFLKRVRCDSKSCKTN